MAIEDIPEMQVGSEIDRDKPFNLDETPILYGGNFIVIGFSEEALAKGGEQLSSRRFVYSFQGADSHPFIFDIFDREIGRDHGLRYGGLDIVDGGGHLKIDDKKIVFSGNSTSYGKYNEVTLRPIAERWAKQNLPNHEIVFQ
jgi:hypothetical protein